MYSTVQLNILVTPKVKGKYVLVHAKKANVGSSWIHSSEGGECSTARPGHFIPKGKLPTPIEPDAELVPASVRTFWAKKNRFPRQESNYSPLIVQKAAMTPQNIPYKIYYATNKFI